MELFLDFSRDAGLDPAGPDATAFDPARVLQAEQLLGCYQTFLGHELPNKLVPIQAFARLVEAQADNLDDESRGLLERLASMTQSVDGLVRRVAEIGRLGREPPFGPPLSLDEVVHEAAAEVICSGTPLDCQIMGPAPLLKLSRRLLHTVFVQLFRNAAQAGLTERPVRVQVVAELNPAAFPAWAVALCVRDDGRGLADGPAGALFQPFAASRGQGSAAPPALGLFLVRQVLTRWAGAVHLRSAVNEGTAVTLLLPPGMTAEGGTPSS